MIDIYTPIVLLPKFPHQSGEETLCEFSARVCYNSQQKLGTNPKFLEKKILQSGHLSVLEHARFIAVFRGKLKTPGFISFITLPGVFTEPSDGGYVITFNLRHLIENKESFFVQKLVESLPKINILHNSGGNCKLITDMVYTKSTENVELLSFVKFGTGSMTVLVHDISRSCSMQLIRHRTFSFSQESQRYVDMISPKFVYPPTNHVQEYRKFYKTLSIGYNELRRLGEKKEDARFVLPEATVTKMVVTLPFATINNFFNLRCSKHAQWEIRNIANQIKNIYNSLEVSYA